MYFRDACRRRRFALKKVSGAKTSVKGEVMSRMVEYQAALLELDAAESACTEGTEAQLARMESAQGAFEAAGG
jgi:hypothetical protein